MTDIDFDALNRELEESAARRKITEEQPLPFEEFFPSIYVKIVQSRMEKAAQVKDIDYYFDLDSKGLTLFIRRLIRRANKFLFHKNFDNQRKFNSLVLDSNQLLFNHIIKMEKLLEQNRQTIQSLQAKIKKLEEQK